MMQMNIKQVSVRINDSRIFDGRTTVPLNLEDLYRMASCVCIMPVTRPWQVPIFFSPATQPGGDLGLVGKPQADTQS